MIRARASGLKPAQDWISQYAAAWDRSFRQAGSVTQTKNYWGNEMKSEVSIEGNRLRLTRVFEGPRDRVFHLVVERG